MSFIAKLIMHDTDGFGGIGSGTRDDAVVLLLAVAIVVVILRMRRGQR